MGAVTSVGRKNTATDIAENTDIKRNIFKSESKEKEKENNRDKNRDREKEKENELLSRFNNIDMNNSHTSGNSEISDTKFSAENNGFQLTRDSITGIRFSDSVRTVQVLESQCEILKSTQDLDNNSSRGFNDSPTSSFSTSMNFDVDDDKGVTDIHFEKAKNILLDEVEEEDEYEEYEGDEEEEEEEEEDIFEKDGPLVMKEIGDEETEWEVEVRNAVVNCPVENRQYHSYF